MTSKLIVQGLAALIVFAAGTAIANHPVLVEGNNASNGGPNATVVPPGTAGDYDGDGLVGTAEDTDNATDRIFGTITAALSSANAGANANGKVTIVRSGRFNELIRIPNGGAGQTDINGVTVLEAAPGVDADIDAVLSGDVAGANAARQAVPGIIVNTLSTDRVVILRNLTIRNYSIGLLVQGNSRVICENCRFDSNLEANIVVQDNARLTLNGCTVTAGGMRFNPTAGVPSPGDGIVFEDTSDGSISRCTISGNTAAGVRNATSKSKIRVSESNVFNNGDDFVGKIEKK